jgi:aerobic carbon-monoxide dehydrogenase medium subunit
MQVPAPFDYERASTVDEAIALLERHGPDARLIAGGHSLIPMMKLRLARPEVLVDINDLTDLAYIRREGDELRIGATARHRDLLESPVAFEHLPIFRDAEQVIADPIVRNRGTVGGSICQADPSEDLSAVFAAVRASMVIRSSAGERLVPSDEFHQGPYVTAVGEGEILVEIRVPIRPGCGSAYEKVERRVGDWAIAAVGACLWLEPDGTVVDVGLGLAAVGAPHFRVPAAEDLLRGGPATEERFAAVAAAAAEGCSPTSDQRGPADYKRHLIEVLTARALRRASARAVGQEA